MAMQITQETFDAIVLENIEEFDMTPEEAVAEAVEQFQAQGVNLDMIVKAYQLKNEDGVVEHAVVRSVNNLKSALDAVPVDPVHVSEATDALRIACDVSLADRCLGAKNGAYSLLLRALDADVSAACLLPIVTALQSLVDGQPDILDEHGATRLLDLIRNTSDNAELIAVLLGVVRRCCVLHEGNRQRFVSLGIIPAVTSALLQYRLCRDVVLAGCSVFAALTLDDDIRVPFGKGHEHAKAIVVEGDALGLLLNLASDYVEDIKVLGDVFSVIGRLSVRDEFCQKVLDLGGVKSILSVLQNAGHNQSLVRSLLVVIKALAGSDRVKTEVVNAGGIALMFEAIRTHQRNAGVCEAGFAAIAALVLRFPEHCTAVIECGGPEVISTTMELHSKSSSVQKQACVAVRNIVSRRPDQSGAFLHLGIESLLRRAMATHVSCYDEARAALRDLDCKIELKELWTGTGRQLEQ